MVPPSRRLQPSLRLSESVSPSNEQLANALNRTIWFKRVFSQVLGPDRVARACITRRRLPHHGCPGPEIDLMAIVLAAEWLHISPADFGGYQGFIDMCRQLYLAVKNVNGRGYG
jgi:hypothetical protein